LVGDQVRVLAFIVADGGWLGRAERLDLPVWVAAAQLGVGGDGQLAGPGGGLLPFLPAGHDLGEGLFPLLVEVAQGAVAGGQSSWRAARSWSPALRAAAVSASARMALRLASKAARRARRRSFPA